MLDVFGLDETLPSTSQKMSDAPRKPLSCPITVLCTDVQVVMGKLNYAIHRGNVYKRVAKSQFTYQYLCTAMMGNDAFRDRLVRHIQFYTLVITNVCFGSLFNRKASELH